MWEYILSLDQGTTSSRALLIDKQGRICSSAQKEYCQIFPKAGWVEHDPMEIWSAQLTVAVEAMSKIGVTAGNVAAIGITNQRETTVVWDRNTGLPVYNAIVWQCRRTAGQAEKIKNSELGRYIQETTGLISDPYFSATKIAWILDNVEGAREKAERGDLLFGTTDSWLIWKLTGGEVHATDYTNASRTMLYDIHKLCWDQKILDELHIPASMLPQVRPSSYVFGYTKEDILGGTIPISGVAGDQQSALFGQCCFEPGEVKNTYGTGCFLLMHTGKRPVEPKDGLLTTIAATADGDVQYALEGSVFVAGAAIQWLRDEMGLISSADETEEHCRRVQDTSGVYLVPAFTGLGAPYWDPYARGVLTGITRGTNKDHVIRATVEALAYQVSDLVAVMEETTGIQISALKADGGASANNFLMQFQADILQVPVLRPETFETTALGAAYLAGLAIGYYRDLEEIKTRWKLGRRFVPEMNVQEMSSLICGWKRAVSRSFGLAKDI